MKAAFLLDTSFLITLADDNRPHHATARRYYEEALQQGTLLHVSTLALAEFATKQDIIDLPLRTFRIEPFNIDHANASGRLNATLMPARDASDKRAVVRADLQLIAQAVCENIPFILTEDRNTLSKYVERAQEARICPCHAILLAEGFDAAWFNEGQKVLDLSVDNDKD